MINKKMGFVALTLMTAALAACGGNGGQSDKESFVPPVAEGSDNLTFWCPDTDTEFMAEVVKEFKKANPNYTGTITLKGTVGEGDVFTEANKDKEAAADIVCLADDNVRKMNSARLLVSWSEEEAAYMAEQSGETAVKSMQSSGKTYAIPYRGDNGYQLIYDKTLLSADDVKSFEGLLAKAKEIKCTVGYGFGTGWYAPAAFFANGVTLEFDANDKFQTNIDGKEGQVAMRALSDLYAEYGGTTWLPTDAATGFGPGAAEGTRKCAQIIWDASKDIGAAIGAENVGIAQLPTMKFDGVDKQLYTYAGYKGMGIVKKDSMKDSKLATAKAFVLFATSTAMQEKRIVELKQGVTDLKVVAKTELWTNPFTKSLAAQVAAGKTKVQGNATNDNWWTAAETLMDNIENQKGALSDADIVKALQTAKSAIIK